jgi:hypothetical protein
MGWFSKPAPAPPPPDYKAQAEATATSNQSAQTAADWANRPDVVTPWGTESWASSQQIDPATGKPVTKWTQTQSLDLAAQQTLDAQQAGDLAKAQLAQQQLGRLGTAFGTELDTSGMQALAGVPQAGQGLMSGLDMSSLGAMPQADAAERQRIENMLYERQQPAREQAQQGLETKLQNMGLTRGTPQFNRELQRLQDQQSRERYDAMQTGGAEMERTFGMGMQGRQQAFNELMGAGQFQNQAQAQGYGQQQQSAAYQNQLRQQQMAEAMQKRNLPLNEYNALMSGTQVGQLETPDFAQSRSAGGADYTGAARDTYQAQQDAYNAKQASKSGLMSGLTGLGGLAIKAAPLLMASDIRLKSNIVRVGTHPLGVGIYEYDIFGERRRGVMAHEMLKVAPERVYTHPSGYLMVDYGGL